MNDKKENVLQTYMDANSKLLENHLQILEKFQSLQQQNKAYEVEIEKLKKEINYWEIEANHFKGQYELYFEKLKYFQQQKKVYGETLKFYADKDNYSIIKTNCISDIHSDRGEKARISLSHIK